MNPPFTIDAFLGVFVAYNRAIVLQASLFVVSGFVANAIHFEMNHGLRSVAGAACIIYAMVAYPILGLRAGDGLMEGLMFGVAPCPTIIFTIGMLLMARGPWMGWLSIIPLLWSLIGLAAAVQIGIPEDLGLAVAGLVLLVVIAAGLFQSRDETEAKSPSSGSATG